MTLDDALKEIEARARRSINDPYAAVDGSVPGHPGAFVTTLCAKVGGHDVPRLIAALRYATKEMIDWAQESGQWVDSDEVARMLTGAA